MTLALPRPRSLVVHEVRAGLGGRPMRLPKLRTPPGRLGHLVRVAGLDELPQLGLLLTGHMALIGPRPVPFEELAAMNPADAAVYVSHRPGFLGEWVVLTGHGQDHRFRDKVRVEVAWLNSRTRRSDVLLLARLPLGLFRAIRRTVSPSHPLDAS